MIATIVLAVAAALLFYIILGYPLLLKIVRWRQWPVAKDLLHAPAVTVVVDDLAVKYGFAPARSYAFAWNRFDNMTGALSVIAGAATAALPTEWNSLSRGEYLAVLIRASGDDRKIVTVFVRKSPIGAPEVVGVERTW